MTGVYDLKAARNLMVLRGMNLIDSKPCVKCGKNPRVRQRDPGEDLRLCRECRKQVNCRRS